jgi:hypothetical protein
VLEIGCGAKDGLSEGGAWRDEPGLRGTEQPRSALLKGFPAVGAGRRALQTARPTRKMVCPKRRSKAAVEPRGAACACRAQPLLNTRDFAAQGLKGGAAWSEQRWGVMPHLLPHLWTKNSQRWGANAPPYKGQVEGFCERLFRALLERSMAATARWMASCAVGPMAVVTTL